MNGLTYSLLGYTLIEEGRITRRVKKTTIVTLKNLAPKILEGDLPDFSGVTAQKAAAIAQYMRSNPGMHSAEELGKTVDWTAQHTRQVLAAIGLKATLGKGYEWESKG